jgi:hypothetical protein
MRILLLSLLFCIASVCTAQTTEIIQPVNAIIGDTSYVLAFGNSPNVETDENVRINTHLAYVEDQLQNKIPNELTPEQRKSRKHLIDLLHNYRVNGIFPRNYDNPGERLPCFIDPDGRVCALGYLIEQTAGRSVAEQINQQHQYEYLLAINEPVVDNWIANSGLTTLECAMIQPTYDYMKRMPQQTNGLMCNCSDTTSTSNAKHKHCGTVKHYDANKQIVLDGVCSNGKFCCGKYYVYNKDGLLKAIKVYKQGTYVGNGVLEK